MKRARALILTFTLLFAAGCADDETASTSANPGGEGGTPEDVSADTVQAEEDGDSPNVDEDGTAPDVSEPDALQDVVEPVDDAVDTVNPEEDTTPGEDTTPEEDTADAEVDPPKEDEIVDCGTPAVSVGECDVTPGSDVWVLHGTVLGTSATYLGGEVVIANGEIKCVGCDCGDSQGVDGATRITCGQGVISPGLINAHDHITFTQYPPVPHGEDRYDHRHEWRKGLNGKKKLSVTQNFYNKGETWGELRLLFSGATSVLGSGGEEGFLRNLDKDYLLEGLNKPAAEYDTFPLGDSSGTLSDSGCGAYNIDLGFNVDNEFAYCPHVAEGINDYALNEFLCLSGIENGSIDVVASNSAFIHGIGITATEVALMAGEGTGLIWSPRSNISLYGHTASVTLYDRLGAGIALGTDWTASGSMNMLREVQCADLLNSEYLGGYFSDRQIWEMATYNGALLLGYGDVLGALEPNFVADIAIFRDNGDASAFRSVIDAGVEDVLLVLRGGLPLYGRSGIFQELPSGADGCESMDVCGQAQHVCIQRETGETLASLTNGVSGGTFETYPLFFCDTPQDEPTCVPSRPGEFSGLTTADDVDGDGVPNELDNCPAVFNAPRPVDGDIQSDKDGDTVGDVCDPCPFDANTDACTSIDPNDLDGDGTPNAGDNCVNIANVDQADFDQDGKGDACDKCPEYANPGAMGCLVSIYEVASGEVPENEAVYLENLVVTAIGGNGFFVQLNPASALYNGPEFSGIWVYNGSTDNLPAVGTEVAIAATYQTYFGEPELSSPTLTVTGSGIAIDPVLASPAELATGGTLSAPLTGVLVVVKDVTVETTTPDPAGQSQPTNEFQLVGGLIVDDYFYKVAPFPEAGDTIASIAGVLKYSWSNTKLVPRSIDDVKLGPPSLDGFSEPTVFVTESTTGATNPSLFVEFTAPVEVDTFVAITSSAPETAAVPEGGVTVLAGTANAEVTVISGNAAETPVTLIAEDAFGNTATVSVTVLAADAPPVFYALIPSSASATPGGAISVQAKFSTPVPAGGIALNWTATTPEGEALPPQQSGSLVVDEGVFVASFQVTMPDAPTVVTVEATVGDITLSTEIEVTTLISAGLILSEVYYDEPGDDAGTEWIKIYNASGDTLDLSNYSLAWGGTSWTYGILGLSGEIAPWSCMVIGGPVSTDNNGNPTFDIAQDLDPDVQNSGATADGIALFALQPFEITESSVPLDAVIYGGENTSGLIGPDGQVAPVHVADVPSGVSLQRVSLDTWTTSETPSPATCPALAPVE